MAGRLNWQFAALPITVACSSAAAVELTSYCGGGGAFIIQAIDDDVKLTFGDQNKAVTTNYVYLVKNVPWMFELGGQAARTIWALGLSTSAKVTIIPGNLV